MRRRRSLSCSEKLHSRGFKNGRFVENDQKSLKTHLNARGDESKGSLGAVVSGEHGVNGLALLLLREEDGVGDDGDVAIDVDTQVKFDDIALLDNNV